jgi:hypothetical protein
MPSTPLYAPPVARRLSFAIYNQAELGNHKNRFSARRDRAARVDIFFPFFTNCAILIFETSAATRGGKEKRR